MTEAIDERAGLCASCVHARTVESSKGSTFVRCELSFRDPRFARYPGLPVTQCGGHQKTDDTESGVK